MILHSYDPIFQIYTRSFKARLDPMETAVKGEESYLIPANCTDVDPPETSSGTVARWDGIKWEIIDDHRGKVIWRTTPPYSAEVMHRPGSLPAGYTDVEPPAEGPYTYLAWKEDKWILLDVPHATEEKIIANLARVAVRREAIRKAIELGWLPEDYSLPSYPKP